MDLYLHILLVLAGVLILIGVLAAVFKHFGLGQRLLQTPPKNLEILETLTIDSKRQLIIVRRQQKEHLLLLGGVHDLLIESYDRPLVSEQTDVQLPNRMRLNPTLRDPKIF